MSAYERGEETGRRIAAVGREFEPTVNRLTDNQEIIAGLKAFLRLSRRSSTPLATNWNSTSWRAFVTGLSVQNTPLVFVNALDSSKNARRGPHEERGAFQSLHSANCSDRATERSCWHSVRPGEPCSAQR